MDVNMVLGVCRAFLLFSLTHACGISFGEKSQKVAFFRPKKTQKRASGNSKKGNALGIS